MNMTGLLSEAAAGKEDDTIFREHVVYLRRKIAGVNTWARGGWGAPRPVRSGSIDPKRSAV